MTEKETTRKKFTEQFYSGPDDFNKMEKDDQDIFLYLRDVFAGK